MKSASRVFVLFLFLVVVIPFTCAESDFQGRAKRIAHEMEQNFSLNDVKLTFDNVWSESATSLRYPFSGYRVTLDEHKLENITDVELRGLLAHELSHLEAYSQMNFVQLVFYGLHYVVWSPFKRSVERETDLNAIHKGFGEELLAFRTYRLGTADEDDREVLVRYYLSPDEIKNLDVLRES